MFKRLRKFRFTLIEITVAFGVLAILIMLLMQFLNTAQKSWNFAEKRARAYSDSCVAFEIIERLMKSAETITINGNKLSVTAPEPYGSKDYANMTIENNDGTLQINSEDLIYNVHSFACISLNNSYIVRLVIFGSQDEYDLYEGKGEYEDIGIKDNDDTTYSEEEKEFLAEHSFSFIRVINLQ